jgi:hypothetical protein
MWKIDEEIEVFIKEGKEERDLLSQERELLSQM